uniref:LRRNT domain-containing protein n=1 Tax=Strongyloides stercoralis TaxID=6248 RepID=A0A0K0DWS9_STRER
MSNFSINENQSNLSSFTTGLMKDSDIERKTELLNQSLISKSNGNSICSMPVCFGDNMYLNYQNQQSHPNNKDSFGVHEKKSLLDLISIPIPKSEFNVTFDILNVHINDLLEYKFDPTVYKLLQHKICQHIVEAFNDEKKKDSSLSDSVELPIFIKFVNERFKCSESQLMAFIGADFMKFFRSPIASQYFYASWSNIKKNYVISVTTATPNNSSNIIQNSSICSNDNKMNSSIFDEPFKKPSFIKPSYSTNYRFSNQLNVSYSKMSNVLIPLNNPLNQPKPIYYMDEIDHFARCIMGKIMVYFCYFLALPRNEILTSYFKDNMTVFTGYTFNKDWYKLLFGKTTMAKMFNEIFYNEITCQTGITGGSAIFCFINEQELWKRIDDNVKIYNTFGIYEIDLNKLKTVKNQTSRYLFDAKNWIPMNCNAISLFGFNARGIYLN